MASCMCSNEKEERNTHTHTDTQVLRAMQSMLKSMFASETFCSLEMDLDLHHQSAGFLRVTKKVQASYV